MYLGKEREGMQLLFNLPELALSLSSAFRDTRSNFDAWQLMNKARTLSSCNHLEVQMA